MKRLAVILFTTPLTILWGNWPDPTSAASAPSAAYTLIETAELNGLDPEAQLADALARINDHNIHSHNQLLPWNWKAQPARLAV